MAILKHGKFYKEPEEHTATCPKCDCVFTYIDSMVKEEWQRLNLYESGHIYDYVICPECKCEVKVKEHNKKWYTFKIK